ncbi:hypothetical protein [Campylobacter geochelonis]|uniref:hypothetical protein n=1 Tax=Campylobacter geochelonis TaxID=1780362 RepID=UPI00094CEF49|nr:hypothetical protein [Campylobacter geochelonis]QKF71339.1 putative membrane protein [Campylobacter geochelonis]
MVKLALYAAYILPLYFVLLVVVGFLGIDVHLQMAKNVLIMSLIAVFLASYILVYRALKIVSFLSCSKTLHNYFLKSILYLILLCGLMVVISLIVTNNFPAHALFSSIFIGLAPFIAFLYYTPKTFFELANITEVDLFKIYAIVFIV